MNKETSHPRKKQVHPQSQQNQSCWHALQTQKRGRDVAVADMPNAFIQTRVEDKKDMVFMKIRRTLVDMSLDIAPDVCGPHVTADKKGIKQLLVQHQNAIWGAMAASMLHCQTFCRSLTGKGFEFNSYDQHVVVNKLIKKKQMTIAFHVDDCKLSHKNPKQMDSMTSWFKEECESMFEDGSGKMAVSRGKVHACLGMTPDFTTKGQVKISMFLMWKRHWKSSTRPSRMGAALRQARSQKTCSRSMKIVRSWTTQKPKHSTT
jgi:hypothetical protein